MFDFSIPELILIFVLHGFATTAFLKHQANLRKRNLIMAEILVESSKQFGKMFSEKSSGLIGTLVIITNNIYATLQGEKFNMSPENSVRIAKRLEGTNDIAYLFASVKPNQESLLSEKAKTTLLQKSQMEDLSDIPENKSMILCVFSKKLFVWKLSDFTLRNPLWQLFIPVLGPIFVVTKLLSNNDGPLITFDQEMGVQNLHTMLGLKYPDGRTHEEIMSS